MNENILFKTWCSKGWLVLYDNRISIELKILINNVEALAYSQITGVKIETNIIAFSFLFLKGKGMATIRIFSKGNQELILKNISEADAKKVQEIILSKIT